MTTLSLRKKFCAYLSAVNNVCMSNKDWPLWEVFIRSKQGLNHKHVGSLHATDAKMAIENARDVYTRRMEGVSIWVVRSEDITASSPDDKDILFDPANDKVYRHPTFYNIPPEVGHM
ncbi:MAG: phenylacetate-CoA oxygenase [Bacteroidota bacterium]